MEVVGDVRSLDKTKIYRSGVTAPHLNYETDHCSFNTNTNEQSLELRFSIASKGGGTTSILVRIGLDDLPAILTRIVIVFPENISVLSECAAIANKQNLNQARKAHADEIARAKSLIDELEPVAEFVLKKILEAPAGEDEKEESVRRQVDKVINTLHSLR